MSRSRVADLMSDCITISQETPVLEVINRFEKEHISGAPVVDANGKYVGVVSRTDLASGKFMLTLEQGRRTSEIKIKELMNPRQPIVVNQDDPLDNAIELMDKNQIHRVFVKDGNEKIIGIVTALNVVSAMRYSFESYL